MTGALYMDVQVHAAITAGLRRHGADVLTAQQGGSDALPDPALLDRAPALGRVLFTNDRDFLAECARRQSANEPFGGVAYAHPRKVPIGKCIDDLELIARASDPVEMANRVERLPL